MKIKNQPRKNKTERGTKGERTQQQQVVAGLGDSSVSTVPSALDANENPSLDPQHLGESQSEILCHPSTVGRRQNSGS